MEHLRMYVAEGMDLAGFEPAPATLTECRAPITPQAHASQGTDAVAGSHGHLSHCYAVDFPK